MAGEEWPQPLQREGSCAVTSPTRKGDGPGGRSRAGWPARPHPGFATWNLQTPVSPSGAKGPLKWDRSSLSTPAVTVASRCSFRSGGCGPERLVLEGAAQRGWFEGWDGIRSDWVGHKRSISSRASDSMVVPLEPGWPKERVTAQTVLDEPSERLL